MSQLLVRETWSTARMDSGQEKTTPYWLLRLGLTLRTVLSLALVGYLTSVRPGTFATIFLAFAVFAMTDGVLALAVAGLTVVARLSRSLAIVAVAGGLVR